MKRFLIVLTMFAVSMTFMAGILFADECQECRDEIQRVDEQISQWESNMRGTQVWRMLDQNNEMGGLWNFSESYGSSELNRLYNYRERLYESYNLNCR